MRPNFLHDTRLLLTFRDEMDYKSYFAGSAIFHPSKFHVVVDFNIKFNYKEENVCIYS